jgi:hypothetical protein
MHYRVLDDFASAVLNSGPIQCKVTTIVVVRRGYQQITPIAFMQVAMWKNIRETKELVVLFLMDIILAAP